MAEITVAKTDTTARTLDVWVNNTKLEFDGHTATTTVVPGSHFLIWYATGQSRDKVTISVSSEGGQIYKVEDEISPPFLHESGRKQFMVEG